MHDPEKTTWQHITIQIASIVDLYYSIMPLYKEVYIATVLYLESHASRDVFMQQQIMILVM